MFVVGPIFCVLLLKVMCYLKTRI